MRVRERASFARLRWSAVALLAVVLVVTTSTSTHAYYDDIHYGFTYYIARMVGYTEEQARRLASATVAVDWDAETDPVQGGDWYAGAVPGLRTIASLHQLPIVHAPRWRFHAMRDQLAFTDPVGGGPDAAAADVRIRQQRTQLWLRAAEIGNLGVFMHFFQDEVPHAGYGTKYGHWPVVEAAAVDEARRHHQHIGGATDWLSFRTVEDNMRLAEQMATVLTDYMRIISPAQRPRPLDPVAVKAVIEALRRANPAPTPLTDREISILTEGEIMALSQSMSVEEAWGIVGNRYMSPEASTAELNNVLRNRAGPQLDPALDEIDAALERDGFRPDRLAPFEKIGREHTPYDFNGVGDLANAAQANDFVLSGDLTIELEDTNPKRRPNAAVRVRVRMGKSKPADEEYVLAETSAAPGRPAVFRKLPIGRLVVDVQDGTTELWSDDNYILERAQATQRVRYSSASATTSNPPAPSPSPAPLPSDATGACGVTVGRARGVLDGLRGQIEAGASAAGAVRIESTAVSAEASAVLAELRTLAAILDGVESDYVRVGATSRELRARLEWVANQARVRDQKAEQLATLACRLADEGRQSTVASQIDQNRRGAAGFAREATIAAAEGEVLASEAAQRSASTAELLATIAAIDARSSTSRSTLDRLRASRDQLVGRLGAFESRVSQVQTPIESALATLSALDGEIAGAGATCPQIAAIQDEIAQARQRLLASRNLAAGQIEASAADVSATRALLQQSADLIGNVEARLGRYSLNDARGALEAIGGMASETRSFAAGAGAWARRATECANFTVAPPAAGPAVASTPPAGSTPPSGAPPGPTSANPWDTAAGGGTTTPGSGTTGGGNAWDQAASAGASSAAASSAGPGGGGPSSPTAPSGNVDDLLTVAATLGDPPSCNYGEAEALLIQAQTIAPGDARVATLLARVGALQGRQATALSHYRTAQTQLAADNLSGALASARAARDVGPPCDRATADSLIALIESILNRGRVAEAIAERQRRDANNRAAAAAVLGGLIGLRNSAIGGQGGSPPPPPVPPTGAAPPGPAGGTSATGQYCSIQRVTRIVGGDGRGTYNAVIAIQASAQVTNYMVIPFFSQDGITPEQWAATAGAEMGGTAPPRVMGRGSLEQMDSLARQLCPNPAVPLSGRDVLVQ